ncbi:MAG TPA: AbrB/MazE/SpoVT family DNA-binding domain-containing protein [Candidatus Saccharimonadales bacterium]|nr:AbrB/MazE/SpoVT family DNA-binding domain-containing protein [Candidatus Saccharimonadales bacterium]
MPRISQRKLFLFGRYSLALLLPKKWLRELGIEPGAKVQLEFDKTRSRIVIRLNTAAPTKPAKGTQSPKRLAKDAGWQPIPPL